ncbi:MAG: GNAT family N-acetyltransferase [Anaerolineales bacterium]|nr:GNAT family N-acetyltransferase [Anaerolineales bacterium]
MRLIYRLSLAAAGLGAAETPASDWRVDAPALTDAEALARLMLDAYRGTIDDAGETLAEAQAEVRGYFERPAWLAASGLKRAGAELAGACLVEWWPAVGAPLIGYVMTAARWKGRGVARVLLHNSLAYLTAAGQAEAWAVITAGNTASETLFQRAGFQRQEG